MKFDYDPDLRAHASISFSFVKFSFVRAPVISSTYPSCQAADVRAQRQLGSSSTRSPAQSYHNVPYPFRILAIVIYASPHLHLS